MFSEDFSLFFDSIDGFAVTATINAGSVDGIFDRPYIESTDYAGTQPVFQCAESEVSGVSRGDTITIDSQDYAVVNIEPDGTGITTLVLSEL